MKKCLSYSDYNALASKDYNKWYQHRLKWQLKINNQSHHDKKSRHLREQ